MATCEDDVLLVEETVGPAEDDVAALDVVRTPVLEADAVELVLTKDVDDGGAMVLNVAVAPQDSSDEPSGQQPPSVQYSPSGQ